MERLYFLFYRYISFMDLDSKYSRNTHSAIDHFVADNGQIFAGHHYLIDMWGCLYLEDEKKIKDLLLRAAKSAGADFIGMDDLSEKFTKNEIAVDVVISTQAAMKVVGKLGQILGPKGLMPNPKTGTVTDNVADAVKNAKSGQVRFRTDKSGIVHGCIGKVSFDDDKVSQNLTALVDELKRLKPASAKGIYIKDISISSTMGPGLKLDIAELV